ncbi:hypothetical protein [Sulfurovum sp. NBC37-1]|uniref:hypothetical protein n=1 Tax=Sulfurovum sp. (strain NBC37-1) TaxID=387093 RepID=UPI0001587A5C|nr:hypothetical protein [Sulfurovum sp. NBC37-1]BAF72992.1 conserved hypothetical protein [Sulfurovum sp. NBC37-1]
MKIVFDKIGSTAKPFELEVRGIQMAGILQKSGYHRVLLDANVYGQLELDCDRCGVTYTSPADYALKLTLSDMFSEDKDDLDIIEFLDGVIDLTYILESEINALKESYHYCSKCDDSDEDFEIEY